MDIKSFLKDARDAIDKKDYQRAKDTCTEALEYDNRNFNLFLFLGLSNFNLTDYPASETAYRTALSITPNSPFPLRGLLDLYIKTKENQKLVQVINELLPITSDAAKKKDLYTKKIDPLVELALYSDAITLIRDHQLSEISSNVEEHDEGIKKEKLKLLVRIEEILQLERQKRFKEMVETKMKEKNIPILNPLKAHVIGAPQHTPEQKVEKENIEQTVESLLSKDPLYSDIYQEILFDSNLNAREYLDQVVLERVYSNYIKSLQVKRRFTPVKENESFRNQTIKLEKECQSMHLVLPNSVMPLEILITMMEEDGAIDNRSNRNEQSGIKIVSQKLLEINPQNGIGLCGSGYDLVFNQSDFTDNSRLILEKGVTAVGNSLLGLLGLSRWHVEAKNHDKVQLYTTRIQQSIEYKNRSISPIYNEIFIESQVVLSDSLFNNCDFEQASTLLKNTLLKYKNNLKLLFKLGKLNFEIKRYEQSIEYFKQLEEFKDSEYYLDSITFVPWIEATIYSESNNKDIKILEESKIKIQNSIAVQETYLNLFVYGYICRLLPDKKSESIQALLKSAKLNQSFSQTFSNLGILYQSMDSERSKKCLQRALLLDVLNSEAGLSLSEHYLEKGQLSLAQSIYKEVTNYCLENRKQYSFNVVRAAWAFYRQALIQMDLGDLEGSVTSFLHAIKGNPKDSSCWRGLGEAYRRQTKYIAALKALKRAEEIVGSSIPELNYQIASLNKILGQPEDAIQEFEQVLNHLPDHIPSLKGKAECLLQLSIDFRQSKSSRLSMDHLIKAEETIKKSLAQNQTFETLWKLFGDISTQFYYLPTLSTGKEINHLEKLKQGAEAYLKCLELHHPTRPNILHDLSLNYYHQYLTIKRNNNSTASEEDIFKSAVKCIIQALNIEPNDSKYWNQLGLILMDKYPVQSQHSFIRSIQLDSSNYEPYGNLSLLYLQYGYKDLSNSSLMISKANNPNSSTLWTLQGLLHEINSSTSLANNEYSHITIALDEYPMGEGLLGFGITSFLKDDLTNSYQSLYKYVELNPNSIEGNNYLAIVQERLGNNLESESIYKVGINLVLDEIKKNNQSLVGESITQFLISNQPTISNIKFNNQIVDISDSTNNIASIPPSLQLKFLKINLARVQCKLGKYTESIETLKPYLTDKSTESTISIENSVLWEILGLAYFHVNDRNQSLSSYQKAVSTLPKSIESESSTSSATLCKRKNNLLLTMAKINYLSSKGDIKSTRESIEKLTSTNPKFEQAWYFLTAIYINSQDFDNALKVLDTFHSHVPSPLADSYFLMSDIHLLKKDRQKARQCLLKACHMYPYIPTTWSRLSKLQRLYFPEDPSTLPLSTIRHVSATTKQSSMILKTHHFSNSSFFPPTNDLDIDRLETMAKAYLVEIHSPSIENINQSIQYFKQLVHWVPGHVYPWYTLQGVLYLKALYTNDPEDFKAVEACTSIISYKYQQDEQVANAIDKTIPDFKFNQNLIKLDVLIVTSNDDSEFEKEYKSVLTENEKNPTRKSQLLRLYSKFYLHKEDSTNALKYIKLALKENPNSIILYLELSIIYEKLGLLDASLLCLNKAMGLNQIDGLLITISKIIRIQIIQKKYKDALKLIEEQMTVNNNFVNNPVLLLLKGIALVMLHPKPHGSKAYTNDMNSALESISESLNANSGIALSNYFASIALLNLKNFKMVESHLNSERLISPNLTNNINSLMEKLKNEWSQ
eukprot:gene6143-7653_t